MISLHWKKLFLLLTILAICHCQQLYHVKPDECSQKGCSYPPPDCMTLSEYVLNNNGNYTGLTLTPGEYYLNTTFLITGTETESFSIIGSGSENTTIICTQESALIFSSLSALTVKSVTFASCGGDTVPGVSLTNIDTVNLVDTSFSKSTSGALDIQSCSTVRLTNLMIANNINSQSTIVNVNNSANITLRDLYIAKNSIKALDSGCSEAVFRIDGGQVDADNIQVTDNIGPFGVLVVTNAMVTGNGDWRFESNQVSVGGSLAFVNTRVDFIGNLYFVENKGSSGNNRSTAGLLLTNETTFNLLGSLQSLRNEGYITSILFTTSQLYIVDGSLNLTDNFNALQAVFLNERSDLVITNGSLIVHGNSFRQRVFLNEISNMMIEGVVSVFNNPCTPIASYSAKLILDGQIEFKNNSGVLYAVKSNVLIRGNSTFTSNSINDEFTDGTLAVVESIFAMEGTYTFKDSHYDDENGAGIFASVICKVRLGGTGYFINNTANNGGGIFIDQQSRLELDKGTRLHFINNRAVKGAAIFIGTSVQHAQCESNANECLFRMEDNNNVSLTFQDNIAYPGASVMHVDFDHIDMNIKYPAVDVLNSTVDASKFTGNSPPLYASNTYWFCFCEDDSPENCVPHDPPANKIVFKGKPFSVRARVLKFYGTNVSEPVRANLASSLSAVGSASSIQPSLTGNNGILQSASATECSNFSFTVKSTADSEVLLLNVGETFIDPDKSLTVNINFSSVCPPGFPFNDKKDSCECDKSIKNLLESCEITDETFQKRIEYANYWMAPSNDPRYQGAISWYNNCPDGYCISREEFFLSDDGICANNRSGLLCGQCKGNYSLLLGGDVCGDCSDNAYLALILVFVAAGVLLIAFIFLTQMTVSTGTINGLIFYANILNSNRSVFFPRGFFIGYRVFISLLNLNFGFETCFFDGMDQVAYSGLQFVFPVYMWFLAGVIIVLCRYSVRVSKFFGNSDPVAVLVTIILLSFNSLAQNVISIFYFSTLNVPGGNSTPVWRYDGNVSYLSGNHLILLIVAAAFFLLLLTPYILVLLSAQLLQKSKYISKILRRLRLQPFIHAYLIPFKPNHRYWVGLCLLTRAILLIFFAFGENRHLNLLLIVTTCVLAISMFVATGGIYDKSWIDKLEMSFFLNLGLLTSTTLFSASISQTMLREIATYMSITVALLTFIGIVILHIYWRLMKFKMVNKKFESMTKKAKAIKYNKKQNLIINEPTSTNDSSSSPSTSSTLSTSVTYQVDLREPLLETLLN